MRAATLSASVDHKQEISGDGYGYILFGSSTTLKHTAYQLVLARLPNPTYFFARVGTRTFLLLFFGSGTLYVRPGLLEALNESVHYGSS